MAEIKRDLAIESTEIMSIENRAKVVLSDLSKVEASLDVQVQRIYDRYGSPVNNPVIRALRDAEVEKVFGKKNKVQIVLLTLDLIMNSGTSLDLGDVKYHFDFSGQKSE